MRKVLLVVLSCLLLPMGALAQLDAGAITGRVTDPSGAAVPGAQVSVVHTETNFEYPSETNSEGIYRVQVRPGPYRVTITAGGFKKFVRENVAVRSGDNVALNSTLDVGSLTESVEVTSALPLLETQTSSTGQVMDGDYYYKLPTFQRWTKGVMNQTPGVNNTGGNSWAGALGGWRIMGLGDIGYYEDGVVSGKSNSSDTVDTISASVEEIRVLTTNLPAEYGHIGGGAISVVKKTGTNNLHGQANEMAYTRSMIHRRAFQMASIKQAGQNLLFQEPDFVLTGPVYIPKIYNGKNKTFFMVSGQWMYENSGKEVTNTVPVAPMKNGDFSLNSWLAAGMPANITAVNTIFDPTSLRQMNGQYFKDAFPGNIIPKNRFSKLASTVLGADPWAEPNVTGSWGAGGVSNNVVKSRTFYMLYDTYSWRLDQQINDKIKVYATETVSKKAWYDNFSPQLKDQTWHYNKRFERYSQINPAVGMTWMVSPTLISETKFGWYRYWSQFGMPEDPQQGLFLAKSLYDKAGVPGINKDWYMNPISVYSLNFGLDTNPVNIWQTRTFREDVTKVWRSHAFKMGYEHMLQDRNEHNIPNMRVGVGYTGTAGITTNGQSAGGLNAGNGNANFILGYVNSASYNRQGPSNLPIAREQSLYFQDDWKILPTVTLNLGLRYMYESPIKQKFNNLRVWDPNLVEVDAAGTRMFTGQSANVTGIGMVNWGCPSTTGCLGGWVTPKGNVNNPDMNNFQPRFGLAWHPFERIVFRGGFGVNTQDFDFFYGNRDELSDESWTHSMPSGSISGTYLYNIDQGPVQPVFPARRADGSLPYSGNFQGRSATWLNPNIKNPYAMTWNASIQYQLYTNYAIQMSYEGSTQVGNYGTIDMNSRPYAMVPRMDGSGNMIDLRDPANQTFRNTSLSSAQNFLRPWINWSGVNYMSNYGRQNYHSGTVRLEKRYSGGVSFLSFYTFAKGMSWSQGNPYMDWNLNKGEQGSIQKHKWGNNLTWEFPVGKGRKFFNRGGWFNMIFGGYEIAWTYNIQSGNPASVSVSGVPGGPSAPTRQNYPGYMPSVSDNFRVGTPKFRENWKDIGGDRFTTNNQNALLDCGQMVIGWGNGCAVLTPSWTMGNNNRSTFYLMPQIAASAAVAKDIPIRERVALRLRMNFQNPFHWYNWRGLNTGQNVNTTGDALSFGKINTSTGDVDNASLGGTPIIFMEMALKW